MKTKLNHGFSLISYALSLFLTFHFSLSTFHSFSQGVAINVSGSSANNSAILDMSGNTRGLLMPRMNTNERDLIIGTDGVAGHPPAEGLQIYNTTTKCFEAYINGAWSIISCPVACTPPAAPEADAASNVSCTSFQANMVMSVSGVTSYCFDVATDEGFTSFVSGYNNHIVNNTTFCNVTGLTPNTIYYYRIRSLSVCYSVNSNVITAATTTAPSSAPTAGTHTTTQTQIVWNWNTVSGATGYKWGTTTTYSSATDMSATSTKTETGLTCNTSYTRYVWAYNACGYYFSPVELTQTTSACFYCGTSTVDDIDGNTYNTISINNKCWFRENLKTTKYSNGVSMVDGTSAGNITGDYTTKYYFDYANNPANTIIYGKLYTWAAVMNGASSSNSVPSSVQGPCPTDWYVPSDAEWNVMEKYLDNSVDTTLSVTWTGTDIGNRIKEPGTTHWASGNGGTNSSNFTALPGGYRNLDGTFAGINNFSDWHTSTAYDATNAWRRGLGNAYATIGRENNNKSYGFSVRCVKENPPPSFSCGNTLTDSRDNKTYSTVLIGDQCWMGQNLNYGQYVSASTGQGAAGTQKYCYGNNTSYCNIYGGLYEWAQMMTDTVTGIQQSSCNGTGASQVRCSTPVQGICPSGWHIPSHYEWTRLERVVGGSDSTAFPYNVTTTGWLGTTGEGSSLKEAGTSHWTSNNCTPPGSCNSSGFTGLPDGRSLSSSFFDVGNYSNWWSSTEYDATYAWGRHLGYSYAKVYRAHDDNKMGGFSVRCIKD
ncbi:MAG: hypothetical protein HGB12_02240 [Bacteroidetes bacterium]|nr:hypothetical protein [Bacteroidota bacterium]